MRTKLDIYVFINTIIVLLLLQYYPLVFLHYIIWDRRGRDRMVVGFITPSAVSEYHN